MTTQPQDQPQTVKRTFWAVFAFYFLITFEFFYMASPFAVYFYSVYQPGLSFLNRLPGISWLGSFFMPHIVVETKSLLINAHTAIGAIIALTGFLIFGACAAQVYYHKLTRKAEVTGGLYRHIRHPQYAAFMLCSFGMLLMWPRFLVLVMFVTLSFAYYFLARLEEKECEQKFGKSYVDYKNRTGMFLPFKLPRLKWLSSLPQSRLFRSLFAAALYIVILSSALALGVLLKRQSLDSLYAIYSPQSVSISAAQLDTDTLKHIQQIALDDPQVQAQLSTLGTEARFINYVMPAEWYIAEVPMQNGGGHILPRDYDRRFYKIIFTLAHFPAGQSADGKEILLTAVHKTLIIEAWVDLSTGLVTQVMPASEQIKYDGIPVPIY